MTHAVIEVGPCTVRGPNDARPEWISVAIECIDDEIALLDERPVPVQGLWEDVLSAVAGDAVEDLAVICPTWWPTAWVDRVQSAAQAVAPAVSVRWRMERLRDEDAARVTTLVELAPDFAVVGHPGRPGVVVALRDGDAGAVLAELGASAKVLVDVPLGVHRGECVGTEIADHLRAQGISVAFAHEDCVLRATEVPAGDTSPERQEPRHRREFAVLAGILSAIAVCVGFTVRAGTQDTPDASMPTTVLVEGRVAVTVPADWTAQRVTSGPGSARVEVVSPDDASIALHITQSIGSPDPALEATTRSLRLALAAETQGVFVGFNPADHRAGKRTVTYRELRADRHVAWAVQVDGPVRIAIGCQSAPGRKHLVQEACDRAIRSAHAVG